MLCITIYITHSPFDRQSIDILSSVQSPNLSFLGTPTLSRLSNSFITNSFRGKTPEIISNLVKPLLRPTTSDDRQHQQQEETQKSSQYLLPSRKPSLQQIPEDQKPLLVAHEVSTYQKCSYTQAVVNGEHLYTTDLFMFASHACFHLLALFSEPSTIVTELFFVFDVPSSRTGFTEPSHLQFPQTKRMYLCCIQTFVLGVLFS
jgi:hypothetical protein